MVSEVVTQSRKQKASEAIVTAAELFHEKYSQNQIAERLGLTQARISQIRKTDLFKETIRKLEEADALKNAEQTQVLVQAQFQAQKCVDEFEAWLKQSRDMSSVNAASYAKIMKSINMALDSANADPDSAKSMAKLKLIPNLVRSATLLQQQIATELNQRLGVEEIAKRISQGEF